MYRSGKAQRARRDFYFDYILGPWHWGTFPFRSPRLWWFCRRLDLHVHFGFPMPLIEGRDFIRA
jgi:hypothetical protein